MLYDPSSKSAARQVQEKNFESIKKQATAKVILTRRPTTKGITTSSGVPNPKRIKKQLVFNIAAKLFDAGSIISFDGNNSLNHNSIIMVSNFDLSGPTGDIVQQVNSTITSE